MVDILSGGIAIVDDDAAVLESYQFLLELAGYGVKTYSSAIDYLASQERRHFCVILDQNMPNMTGLELAAMLRSQAHSPPIMLVTSSLTPSLMARAVELGIKTILEKPATEDELLSFVSSAGYIV